MIVNGNIKKIMYMGKEISEARHIDRTVWVKQTVKPPPPPKPCSTCQTRCERPAQCGCQSNGQSCLQQCGNCLYNCQNNQVSES
jgi:hypothetical protein